MGIGKRIREARTYKGLKQDELAKLIGVTAAAIGNYECGVSHPKEKVLYKLFEVLEVDPNFLFQDEVRIKQDTVTLTDKYEKSLINNYRNLSDQGKEYILQTIEMAVKTYKKDSDTTDAKIS